MIETASFQTNLIFQSGLLTAYILGLSFILGTVFGSFFNCMAWRIAHHESIVSGRSHCAVCGHPLSAADLVPVFSYLLLKGRCRYCGEKIHPRYMISELLLGISFDICVLKWGISPECLRGMILFCILLTLSLVDLDCFVIPNSLQIAGIINFAVFLPFVSGGIRSNLLGGLIGGLGIAGGILLISLLFDRISGRESMGGGDIKLYFVTGLYLGPLNGLLCVLVSCVFGLLFSAFMKSRRIPFGPSISAAAALCLLTGQGIVNWYLNLL